MSDIKQYPTPVQHNDTTTPAITGSTGSEPGALHTLLLTTVEFHIIAVCLRECHSKGLTRFSTDPCTPGDLSSLTDTMTALFRAIYGHPVSHGRP